jgi:uncharacterized protein
MKIIISEIPDEGIEVVLTDHLQSDAVRIVSPVEASLRIDKVETDLVASGDLSSAVELQCARCLKNFELKIASPFSVVYHPAGQIGRHEQHELKSDELDTVFYTGDIFDTDDLLKEQLILNLPMKPLCSPDCKGFCPVCGADLNISACDCRPGETETRFEILKKLKTEKE